MDKNLPKKAYIINIKFGIKQWQVWFMGDAAKEEEWISAVEYLDVIGDSCRDADEFYDKVIEHFQHSGFTHIKD